MKLICNLGNSLQRNYAEHDIFFCFQEYIKRNLKAEVTFLMRNIASFAENLKNSTGPFWAVQDCVKETVKIASIWHFVYQIVYQIKKQLQFKIVTA
ncbi:MAG TPA: hypothetical protein DHV48_18900 [Prolixibacteraceae bacterium]|nr:hypothetical protein [Prolixibacteraceae bacterium]